MCLAQTHGLRHMGWSENRKIKNSESSHISCDTCYLVRAGDTEKAKMLKNAPTTTAFSNRHTVACCAEE